MVVVVVAVIVDVVQADPIKMDAGMDNLVAFKGRGEMGTVVVVEMIIPGANAVGVADSEVVLLVEVVVVVAVEAEVEVEADMMEGGLDLEVFCCF